MKVALFDINVILDVLLDRMPHAEASAAAWAAVETGRLKGLLAAHAVTTIHYLVRKQMSQAKAKRDISAILTVFGVAAINGAVIQEALQHPSPDFEDTVSAAAARVAGCDYIVTRDPKGFAGARVRVLTPEALLALLSAG